MKRFAYIIALLLVVCTLTFGGCRCPREEPPVPEPPAVDIQPEPVEPEPAPVEPEPTIPNET